VRGRGSTRARIFGLLATSLAVHIIVFSVLGLVPSPAQVLAMEDIEIEVVEPELAKVEPPPPEPLKEPEPEVKQVRRAAAPAPAPEPPKEKAAAPPEEVADFTGVTLTADGEGPGWTTVVGTGAPLAGPVGKIGTGPRPAVQQAAKTGPVGPRFVPVGSLARKPKPPAGLDELLKSMFPKRARLQAIEGKAKVMLRLLPTGRVTNMRVLDESPPGYGFGDACVQLLKMAGAFSPAFDADGNAVATEIPFNCGFEFTH
jgi:periplasmic protein TonB